MIRPPKVQVRSSLTPGLIVRIDQWCNEQKQFFKRETNGYALWTRSFAIETLCDNMLRRLEAERLKRPSHRRAGFSDTVLHVALPEDEQL